jgi:iron complex transport system substrate-binding protein
VNAAGGNNLYELGVLRPDLVVGDLIAIMHPKLEPDHTFTFYQQLR